MNVWKTFAAHEVTHSTAHYLTALHELHLLRGYARVSDVARHLEVTKGSVSIQMKHLRERGLVEEDENRFLRLTPTGEEIAHEVIRNRQVLIQFLIAVIGIPEDQAKIDACKMEHLLSRETCHQLIALVHFLQSDEPVARKFRERFRDYKVNCPASNCRLCTVLHEAPPPPPRKGSAPKPRAR